MSGPNNARHKGAWFFGFLPTRDIAGTVKRRRILRRDKIPARQWSFPGTNCGALYAMEGVLVSYGAGSIYGPPSVKIERERDEGKPRAFSGITLWQAADVHPCSRPYLLPFLSFPSSDLLPLPLPVCSACSLPLFYGLIAPETPSPVYLP